MSLLQQKPPDPSLPKTILIDPVSCQVYYFANSSYGQKRFSKKLITEFAKWGEKAFVEESKKQRAKGKRPLLSDISPTLGRFFQRQSQSLHFLMHLPRNSENMLRVRPPLRIRAVNNLDPKKPPVCIGTAPK